MTLKLDSTSKGEFFLVVPINFEQWAKQELEEKFPQLNSKTIKGGLELEAPLDEGFILNHYLKIPTKILLRVGTFKAKDFPKLYQEVLKLPLRNFIREDIPKISVSVSQCRLMHTGRIEDTIIDAIKKYNQMYPPKKSNEKKEILETTLLIRGENDQFTVSIDTSGEPLYKRGDKPFTGLAPIRENFAAGILYSTSKTMLNTLPLLDCFCGSGTFIKEALHFYHSSPREYAYQNFPCARKLKIKEKILELNLYPSYEGIDLDDKNIKYVKELLPNIEINKKDVFKLKSQENKLLIGNPPYGKRIELDNPRVFFQTLLDHLLKSNNCYIGMIIPDEILKTLNLPRADFKIPFNNGGIKVTYLLYKT